MSGLSGYALVFALAGGGVIAVEAPNAAGARLSVLAGQRRLTPGSLLAREPGQARLGRLVARARQGPVLAALALALVVVIALLAGPLAALCAAVAVIGTTRWARSAAAGRHSDRARAELSTAVAALSDEYSAGATVADAFRAAASVAGRYQPQFASAAAATSRGGDLRASLVAAHGLPAHDIGRVTLAAVAVAGQLTQGAGASLTAALAGVQADLRHDRELRAAVLRLLAAPRASVLLLSGLPLVGVGLGSAMGARPIHVLLHTTWGAVALIVGLAFELAGVWWTLALTGRAQP